MSIADTEIQSEPFDSHADIEAPAVENTAPSLSTEPQLLPLDESRTKRLTFLLLAIAIVIGMTFFLFSLSAPAPGWPGIDENAYLIAGRMIAEHGTTALKP